MTETMETRIDSDYIETLSTQDRESYGAKISVINGVDPYELPESALSAEDAALPPIQYHHVYKYLVLAKSFYTREQFRAWKSLEAYNQFAEGGVGDVCSRAINKKVVVLAKVKPSQSASDTPLRPWVVCEPDGAVSAAHCTCTAGLGEACSHVGALLFYCQAAAGLTASTTCTQQKAACTLPTTDKADYAEIKHIDFSTPASKKKRIDCAIAGIHLARRTPTKLPNVRIPSKDDVSGFMDRLHNTGVKSVSLALDEKYQDSFTPTILQEGNLPSALIVQKK